MKLQSCTNQYAVDIGWSFPFEIQFLSLYSTGPPETRGHSVMTQTLRGKRLSNDPFWRCHVIPIYSFKQKISLTDRFISPTLEHMQSFKRMRANPWKYGTPNLPFFVKIGNPYCHEFATDFLYETLLFTKVDMKNWLKCFFLFTWKY